MEPYEENLEKNIIIIIWGKGGGDVAGVVAVCLPIAVAVCLLGVVAQSLLQPPKLPTQQPSRPLAPPTAISVIFFLRLHSSNLSSAPPPQLPALSF